MRPLHPLTLLSGASPHVDNIWYDINPCLDWTCHHLPVVPAVGYLLPTAPDGVVPAGILLTGGDDRSGPKSRRTGTTWTILAIWSKWAKSGRCRSLSFSQSDVTSPMRHLCFLTFDLNLQMAAACDADSFAQVSEHVLQSPDEPCGHSSKVC